MQFLPILILSLYLIDKVPDVPVFAGVFEKVRLTDENLSTDEFKPGSSGQSKLRKTFELQTHLMEETVWPSGRRQQALKF